MVPEATATHILAQGKLGQWVQKCAINSRDSQTAEPTVALVSELENVPELSD